MILEKQHPTLLPSVENVAQLIQNFTRQQKARLLQLVPDLQTIQPEEAEIPPEQLELIAYFEAEMEDLPGRRMQDDDIFIAGLTISEFSALPESTQARLWQEEHLEIEQELDYQEKEVRLDAVPARYRDLRIKPIDGCCVAFDIRQLSQMGTGNGARGTVKMDKNRSLFPVPRSRLSSLV